MLFIIIINIGRSLACKLAASERHSFLPESGQADNSSVKTTAKRKTNNEAANRYHQSFYSRQLRFIGVDRDGAAKCLRVK